jgi:hypothetical protein
MTSFAEASAVAPHRLHLPRPEITEAVKHPTHIRKQSRLHIRAHLPVGELPHLDALLGIQQEASLVQEAAGGIL